jgi:hypothetical protein
MLYPISWWDMTIKLGIKVVDEISQISGYQFMNTISILNRPHPNLLNILHHENITIKTMYCDSDMISVQNPLSLHDSGIFWLVDQDPWFIILIPNVNGIVTSTKSAMFKTLCRPFFWLVENG